MHDSQDVGDRGEADAGDKEECGYHQDEVGDEGGGEEEEEWEGVERHADP